VTIQVRYSCGLCGLEKQPLDVPLREAHEDLITWMDATMALVGVDNRLRSPRCRSVHADLYVPHNGADRLGGEAVH